MKCIGLYATKSIHSVITKTLKCKNILCFCRSNAPIPKFIIIIDNWYWNKADVFADSIAKKYYDWNIENILLYLLIEYYLKIDKQYNEFGIQGFKKKPN